jgi:hypothetical protein
MIVVLTLSEDWIPFLLATFYVVLHHGIGSSVGSGHLVFRDADHIAHPWKWAGIHAGFVAAAGLASIVSWRLNERVREARRRRSRPRARARSASARASTTR